MCAICALPLRAGEIGIINTQSLSFGTFVAGDGTITISADGMRATTGDVVPLASDPGFAGQFVLTGDASSTFSVTLPVDGSVTMTNGIHNMPINRFTSSPASTGTLSAAGSQVLSVGGRLDVARDQVAGDYSGSFMIVVDYN